MSWLLERLREEVTAEQDRLADLRAQMELLQAQVTAAEDRLARLAITRETVLSLQQDAPGGELDEPPTAGDDQSGGGRAAVSQPRPSLSGVDEQVVMMLAGRGQAMRARELALAMGEPDKRGRVEVMRSRLKRLATNGWLAEEERGLFSMAAGVQGPGGPAGEQARVNGFAGGGSAAADS